MSVSYFLFYYTTTHYSNLQHFPRLDKEPTIENNSPDVLRLPLSPARGGVWHADISIAICDNQGANQNQYGVGRHGALRIGVRTQSSFGQKRRQDAPPLTVVIALTGR